MKKEKYQVVRSGNCEHVGEMFSDEEEAEEFADSLSRNIEHHVLTVKDES